ncbi:MAG: bis(5'-nucleosyl)-tetraphosphatase (symmetrical) YqeK [Trueperaceae bacterium]
MSNAETTEELLAQIVTAHPVGAYAERVRGMVTEGRFAHIVRVTSLALRFAGANGLSPEQVLQVASAAILHDAARDLSDSELLQLATPELELERRHPLALHGRAGRALASQWGVTDQAVLNAIEGHVFGVPQDDPVGMAVYVADVSEEGRGVNEQIRELAMSDLAAAYRMAVMAKVDYLRREGKEIHPRTLATYHAIVGADPANEPGNAIGAAEGAA